MAEAARRNIFEDLIPKAAPADAPVRPNIFEALIPKASPEQDKSIAFGSIGRGFNQLQMAGNVLLSEAGIISPESAAKAIARDVADTAQYPTSPTYKAGMKEIGEAGERGWGPLALAMLKNPSTMLSVVGESIPASGAMLAAGGAAGLAGTGGAMAGMGIGSFATEYGSSILETLQEAKVDTGNAKAVEAALQNPELMSKARTKAVKRGVPIAMFDAISLGMAGRLAHVIGATAKTASRTRKAVGGVAETAAQAVYGGAGEAAGEIASGQPLDRRAIALEAGAEVVTGAPEIAWGTARHRQEAPPPPPAPGAPPGAAPASDVIGDVDIVPPDQAPPAPDIRKKMVVNEPELTMPSGEVIPQGQFHGQSVRIIDQGKNTSIVELENGEKRRIGNDLLEEPKPPAGLPPEVADVVARPDSPRITPADRKSPIPTDIIDDGKALVEGATGRESTYTTTQEINGERTVVTGKVSDLVAGDRAETNALIARITAGVSPSPFATESPLGAPPAGAAAVPATGTPTAPAAPVRPPVATPEWTAKHGPFRPETQASLDQADAALSKAAGEAISKFVGHGPMSRHKRDMEAQGIMDTTPLEAVARGEDKKTAAEIEMVFAPIRESLRAEHGDTIKLYRVQQPVEPRKPNVVYHGMPKDTRRAALSWTADPHFAESHSGARKDRKPFTEEEIVAAEKEHAKTGKVKIPGTGHTLSGLNRYTDRRGTPRTSVDILDSGGDIVTDTDSVRDYMEGVNADRIEHNLEQAEKRGKIVSADVPLNDVMWATDRAGQAEFIVRNTPESEVFIDETGKRSEEPRAQRVLKAKIAAKSEAAPAAEAPRAPDETDKVFAKRVVDKRPEPKTLPEKYDDYFIMDKATVVPIGDLVSSKSDAENAQGGGNAAKRMQAAAAGELSKRDPITVQRRADGKYLILDGNGTYTSVKGYGWKSMPVLVEEAKEEAPAFSRSSVGFMPTEGAVAEEETPASKLKAKVEAKRAAAAIAAAPLATPEQEDSFVHPPPKTFEQIYAVAEKWQDKLNGAIRSIGKELGIEGRTAGVKGRKRAEEKVAEKGYKSPSWLTDIVRGGFVLENPEQTNLILTRLREHAEVLYEGWKETPAGYFDAKALLRFPDGTVAEIQFWEPNLLYAKEKKGGHDLYEIWRAPESTPEEKFDAAKKMKVLYAGARALTDPVWDNVGKGSKPQSLYLSRQSASDMRPPLAQTSKKSTSTQSPPLERRSSSAIASASPSSAGLQSQVRNLTGTPPSANIVVPKPQAVKPEPEAQRALKEKIAAKRKADEEETPAFQTAAPLQTQPLPVTGTGPGARVKLRDLAEVLTARHNATYGRALDPSDPADYATILSSIQQDYENQRAETENGEAWYVEDIDEAIRITTAIIPELAVPSNRELFLTLAALLSPQQKPRENWGNAVLAMQGFLRDGVIPTRKPNGKQFGVLSHTTGLQLMQHLITTMGLQDALQWVNSMHTGREMAEIRRDSNLFVPKPSLAGHMPKETNLNESKLGIYMMGPKVGDFAQNSTGLDQNAVTIDLWAMRTYNRILGRLLDVTALAAEEGSLPDTPRGRSEREMVKRLFRDAARAAGITPSAMQASLWYFEQRLYRNHGVPSDSQNFSGAARIAAERHGAVVERRADVGGASGDGRAATGSAEPSFQKGKGTEGGRGGADRLQADARQAVAARGTAPLPSLYKIYPSSVGPNQKVVDAKRAYMESVGLPYRRQADYVKADPRRGKRIADAFDAMEHAPQDPEVAAAYRAMIDETIAQFHALQKHLKLKIEFIREGNPYNDSPRMALQDVLENGHLWVFPTLSGFGSINDIRDNPLLEPTGIKIDGHDLVANDIFRIVHDIFGHGPEGAGFGPTGEENAWQSHVRMYSPLAAKAMTSETRGQNSWVNFGPHGEANRADQKQTIFADQKVGILPDWAMTEGMAEDQQPDGSFKVKDEVGGVETTFELTPAFVKKAKALEKGLRAELDRLGLKDIALRVSETITAMVNGELIDADGRFLRGAIDIALSAANPLITLHHEVVHGLRKLGLFGKTEWSILERMSRDKWMAKHRIGELYKGFSESRQIEEGIAFAYQAWKNGQKFDPFVTKAFKKIESFIEALGNALRGQGFRSADSIFRAIDAGQIGNRQRGQEVASETESLFQKSAISAFHSTFESFKKFDFSRLGQSTRPNVEGMGIEGWAMNLASLGAWASKDPKGHKLGTKLDLPVEVLGKGKTFSSLDTLEAAIRNGGGPEAYRNELLSQGIEHIKVADEELGGTSYVALSPDAIRIVEAEDPAFALTAPPASSQQAQQTMQGFLNRGQPVDRAIRFTFDLIGGLDSRNRWRPSHRLNDKLGEGGRLGLGFGSILGVAVGGFAAGPVGAAAGFFAGGTVGAYILGSKANPTRFAAFNAFAENAKAGLVHNYGLDPEYVEAYRQSDLGKAGILRQAQGIMKVLSNAHVGSQEAKVLQAILSGKPVNDADMTRLAGPIRKAIDDLGAEAVSLGLISAESFERNRGAYLHRVYLKHEVDAGTMASWVSSKMASRRKRIIGDSLKGRGIFLDMTVDRLMKDAPNRAVPAKGDMWRVLDRTSADGKVTRRVYVPTNKPIPIEFTFPGWVDKGAWEVRHVEKGQATLWRDYTEVERGKMGELLDARYTIAKTFMLLANDISTGRFYKTVAENPLWTSEKTPAGKSVNAEQFRRTVNDPDIQWVKVPDTAIDKTGGKKRWGSLAGKYVRAEIWRDLNEINIAQSPAVWKKLYRQWKRNKTARNPVVHMNNIMSNVMFMDLADIRGQDLVAGMNAYFRNTKDYKEALDNGAFGADLLSQEIRDEVLKPILDEINKQNLGATTQALVPSGFLSNAKMLGVFADKLWGWAKTADNGMLRAYQAEDEVFRMALYMRRRAQGQSPKMAAMEARDQFLNYDIRAPWIVALKNTVLPFISYSYRAVPKLAENIIDRPWKLAKYMAIIYAVNALAYMGDDDDDEEQERAALRDEEQGITWLGIPRMVRMPWRDQHGLPVFLDVRRWIPAGDIYDSTQGNSALPIPAPLQFGGPLMLAYEFYLNKQAFSGKDITNELTQDSGDKLVSVGDWAWKAWAPSSFWTPRSWYWTRLSNAYYGAKDITGRPYSLPQAALSSVGIKVKSLDVHDGIKWHFVDFKRAHDALTDEQRSAARQLGRGLISREAYNDIAADIYEKRTIINEKRRALGELARPKDKRKEPAQ